MPPVQTSYDLSHDSAFPGQLGNMSKRVVASRVTSGVIPFGRAVVRMADQTAQLANATSQLFAGVSLREQARQADGSHVIQYENGEEAAIVEEGYVWVTVEEAVSAGEQAYFRHTGTGTLGAFRNDNAGGEGTIVVGATFETDGVQDGVALLRMPYSIDGV